MGLSKIKGKTIFLDTAPLIYFIEGHSTYQTQLKKLFASFDKGEFTFITSALTLLEVLVQPIKMNRQDLMEKYKYFLTGASGIEIIEIGISTAIKAAEMRAKYGLKTPDSIQVATALENSAAYFLTNDIRLKTVKEIKTILPADI